MTLRSDGGMQLWSPVTERKLPLLQNSVLRVHAACALGMIALVGASACSSDGGSSTSVDSASVYGFANGCYVLSGEPGMLVREEAGGYAFAASGAATPFFLKPSGLGTYLLFDDAAGFLVSDGVGLQRAVELQSDVTLVRDGFQSEAEWELISAAANSFVLRHLRSGRFLAAAGMAADAATATIFALEPATGCAEFPEESTHSEGDVVPRRWEDGDVFGISDIHSHILANFAFGGGGIFHGAPFHSLGVEHALGSCEKFHGFEGRKDLFGFGFDNGSNIDFNFFFQAIFSGRLPSFNHHTDGHPTFTTWPSASFSSTHQVQYYKWLERAWRGGLRLVVQHAVNNQMICDFLGNGHIQPIRYPCYDMVAVDRQIEEIYRMQDYIDAQEGGPGRGWFRIATSPEQARGIINSGRMAVVLGIETSTLFNCFLTTPDGFEPCTEEIVAERLEDYYDRGVRVLFPVHKYDNAFSAGDGHKGFIELGNFLQTGHFGNFTSECDPGIPGGFDGGRMAFPGLNEPRDNYVEAVDFDFQRFYDNLFGSLSPILGRLISPPPAPPGEHCQKFGLTPLGEFLIERMMKLGMLIEVDHFPRKSYRRVFEMLNENDYPAVGSHGRDFADVYRLGGVSTGGFSTCRSTTRQATVDDGFQRRLQKIVDNGGYPGLGFGFDLNGFAGAPGPRFGPRGCGSPQTDPVTYPFTSYAGDVTFQQPKVGVRTLDFNTEGLVHIGLLPEMIEDVRRDGVTDEELEPLFRSAEAYLRTWEKAERRAGEIN